MNIVSANYTEHGAISVVVEDMPPGSSITVPADPANMDYVELQEWATEPGNEILAYEAPGPTPEQIRIAALLAVPSVVELVNVLKTGPEDIDDWADDNATSAVELRMAFRTLLKLLAAKIG